MSHGTPGTPADIEAFYTEIRRGRRPAPELLADLERRYRVIGGTSPLAQRTAAQIVGVEAVLERLRPGRYVVASGTKFAQPRIADAVGEIARAGARRVIGVVLAPHSSFASVGDYARRARQAVDSARVESGAPLELEVVDRWHVEDGLISLLAERVEAALSDLSGSGDGPVEVIFTAHSVPARLKDEGDDYADQVHASSKAVARVAGLERWQVAWQSAGRTGEEWLGPDVRDVIASAAQTGARGVVVCPIGFVSDHLEVLYDLDVEAAQSAKKAGLRFARTESLNDDPRFCEVLARVVLAADSRSEAER